jgi:P27 family predicted phage terminase small subunit
MTTKRGRRSVGDLLTVVPVTGQRLDAPDSLSAEQVTEWKSIVDSLPADYFRPGDVPLLSAYCVATSLYKRAAADMQARGMTLFDDKGREVVNPVHQILTSQASAMAQMAIKLRLCPSARYSEKQAATKTGDAAKPARPWETGT